jgi:hypothetical protein
LILSKIVKISSLDSIDVSENLRLAADSANDAIPVDETVRVPQDLINRKEFKSIDVGIDYKSVLALATLPAQAASVQIEKVGVGYRRRRLKAIN